MSGASAVPRAARVRFKPRAAAVFGTGYTAVEDLALSEHKTIYEDYLNYKNRKINDDKIKLLMQKRIVELQEEKGITNYRIYKTLNLNPGNVNAFLKNGDTGKVGLDTVRRMLAYVNG